MAKRAFSKYSTAAMKAEFVRQGGVGRFEDRIKERAVRLWLRDHIEARSKAPNKHHTLITRGKYDPTALDLKKLQANDID